VVGAGGHARASLRGFGLAFDAVSAQREQARWVERVLSEHDDAPAANADATPAALLAPFPTALHDIVALGHARVAEYQDAGYGQRYLERLQRVLAAERAGDPAGAQAFTTTRETARWLALWMAFDDIVRVAELKARASRAERVRREVKAKEGELLRTFDHFKPGAPEFAALLPERLAQRVLAWDRRRVQAGKAPWALPIKVASHGVLGLLALRALAACKRLRPRGSRFATEQVLIERWLAAVERGARADARLGHELAQCGRLIKGYGSTNERGKDNLLHIVDHLTGSADAVAQARQAALADEAGTALDLALQQHGAPARPVKPQPIRWHHNPRLKKQRA
jgi:indolepyruvate ferredoxin oxidoreductase beta subunit